MRILIAIGTFMLATTALGQRLPQFCDPDIARPHVESECEQLPLPGLPVAPRSYEDIRADVLTTIDRYFVEVYRSRGEPGSDQQILAILNPQIRSLAANIVANYEVASTIADYEYKIKVDVLRKSHSAFSASSLPPDLEALQREFQAAAVRKHYAELRALESGS